MLAITVLVINQVLRIRHVNDRAKATASQAAIVLGQARRAAGSVSSATKGSDERAAAVEEVRTYLMMLLIAAPVLIDSPVPRAFLEQGQKLAAVLASARVASDKNSGAPPADDRLGEALGRLRSAAAPLLEVLSPAQRAATGADDVQ